MLCQLQLQLHERALWVDDLDVGYGDGGQFALVIGREEGAPVAPRDLAGPIDQHGPESLHFVLAGELGEKEQHLLQPRVAGGLGLDTPGAQEHGGLARHRLHEGDDLVIAPLVEPGGQPELHHSQQSDFGGPFSRDDRDVEEGEGLVIGQPRGLRAAIGAAGGHDQCLAVLGGLADGGVDGGLLAGIARVISLLEAGGAGALELLPLLEPERDAARPDRGDDAGHELPEKLLRGNVAAAEVGKLLDAFLEPPAIDRLFKLLEHAGTPPFSSSPSKSRTDPR